MKKKIQFFKASVRGMGLLIRYGPAKVSLWREQAMIDDLTGLYNRRFLHEAGKRELAKALRSEWQGEGYSVSFIFVDIDNLKRINDEEGHAAGDKVLQSVAALLEKCCREVDIVSRVGGDEFNILLPQTGKEGAQLVIDRLKELAKKELVSSKGRPISLSCGLAQEFSLKALKETADAQMYQQKGSKMGKKDDV